MALQHWRGLHCETLGNTAFTVVKEARPFRPHLNGGAGRRGRVADVPTVGEGDAQAWRHRKGADAAEPGPLSKVWANQSLLRSVTCKPIKAAL